MSLENTTPKVTASGNGVATVFSFAPIVVYSPREAGLHDLVVTKVVVATEVETVLTEGSGASNYSVSVSSYPGTGSITFPATGATRLATGEQLVIKRKLALKQYATLSNQGAYLAETQEEMHNRHTMIDLQQQEEIDRAVKVSIGDTRTPEELLEDLLTASATATTQAGIATTQAGLAATARVAAELAETNAETAEVAAELAETNAEAAQALAESAAGAVAFPFTFDDATAMADPGAGEFRFNNAAVASVTAIAIDDSTSDAADISAFVATWDDSTNTVKGHLVIRKRGAPTTFAVFAITGLTDNAGWAELAVAHVTSNGAWTAADAAYIQYLRAGDKGTDGAGTVVSVTAGDASVAIGGTAANPTVAVAALGVATGNIAANAVTPAKMSRSGNVGQLLTSNGAGADPSYQDAPSGAPAFLLLNAGVI
jgi:hypothetical protein